MGHTTKRYFEQNKPQFVIRLHKTNLFLIEIIYIPYIEECAHGTGCQSENDVILLHKCSTYSAVQTAHTPWLSEI